MAGAGALADDKEAVDTATPLLHFTYSFLNALIYSLPPGVPEPLHAAPPDQPLVAVLAEALEASQVLNHAARVLLLLVMLLYPPDPSGGWSAATDSEAELELWRLGVSARRWDLPWVEVRNCCCCLEEAWRRAEMGSVLAANPGADSLRLLLSPSRPVAAALSGGLLPWLQFLLHSAGRDPGGWQAAAVGELAWLGHPLAPLLAYGDAAETAALVAMLAKLLRRAQADTLHVEGVWDSLFHTDLSLVSGLNASPMGAQNCSQDQQAAEGAPGPAGPAGGGGNRAGDDEAAPEPASPASQQLAYLLSLAACHWLPPLSRLAQAALTPQPLCADPARGAGSGDIGGGGCGDASGIASLTAASLLLSASLASVPLLRLGRDALVNALICSLPPGLPEPLHAAPPDQPLVAELAEALEAPHS
ncbi:hypothetical protein GPECTOR_20g493 [Gonium pectorale]|uniref:Uncharacterized protein n=1 Tax=Gonium pectorale TaxID=33097 RepID=A0A150GIJ9_GONPE|nr:hypothetical protein GPECTOR_20g493 [Gonium pectorale]|eukprot:KXZ49636.1 hypothetical protein GPECTOR_20g493 [Gonium pectorale]